MKKCKSPEDVRKTMSGTLPTRITLSEPVKLLNASKLFLTHLDAYFQSRFASVLVGYAYEAVLRMPCNASASALYRLVNLSRSTSWVSWHAS